MAILPALLLTLCTPMCGLGPDAHRIELHHLSTGTTLCIRFDARTFCHDDLQRHWNSVLSDAAATLPPR